MLLNRKNVLNCLEQWMWNLNTLKCLSTILSLFVAASEGYYAITGTFPPRPYISLPWANEVPPDVSVINIKALKHSLRMCELFPVSSRWLSADTPSFLPLSFAFLFSSAHKGSPPLISSLSWDPFDEITLHLDHFPVWWFISREPISGAFQKRTHLFTAGPNRPDPNHPFPPTPPPSVKMKWNGRGGVICEDRVNLLFEHADKEKRWKASWLLSFRKRIICWEGRSHWFGCADN